MIKILRKKKEKKRKKEATVPGLCNSYQLKINKQLWT